MAPPRIGRKPWKCEHTDRPHHAKGLCKSCYFYRYVLKPRRAKEQAEKKKTGKRTKKKAR